MVIWLSGNYFFVVNGPLFNIALIDPLKKGRVIGYSFECNYFFSFDMLEVKDGPHGITKVSTSQRSSRQDIFAIVSKLWLP